MRRGSESCFWESGLGEQVWGYRGTGNMGEMLVHGEVVGEVSAVVTARRAAFVPNSCESYFLALPAASSWAWHSSQRHD